MLDQVSYLARAASEDLPTNSSLSESRVALKIFSIQLHNLIQTIFLISVQCKSFPVDLVLHHIRFQLIGCTQTMEMFNRFRITSQRAVNRKLSPELRQLL